MPSTSLAEARYVLTIACIDKPGIVAAVTNYLYEADGNILEAQQFNDRETSRFFMRVLFEAATTMGNDAATAFREGFCPVADRFGIEWTLRDRNDKKRVMLLVSKFDHCLIDLLYRWRNNELAMDIVAIVANHPRETYAGIDFG